MIHCNIADCSGSLYFSDKQSPCRFSCKIKLLFKIKHFNVLLSYCCSDRFLPPPKKNAFFIKLQFKCHKVARLSRKCSDLLHLEPLPERIIHTLQNRICSVSSMAELFLLQLHQQHCPTSVT